MEVTALSFGVGGVSVILVLLIWKISNALWFKPKKTERSLRAQGLKGSPYKFMFGDVKEMMQMTNDAVSKPMSLTHDIAPRVSPFIHKALTTYGKNCFSWIGPIPMIHVSEPTMIREILANYHKFQKPLGVNPLATLIGKGLFVIDSDQWVKHKKIINPAFRIEKLKLMEPAVFRSCNAMIENWEKMIAMENCCEIDVLPHLQNFSSDVISSTLFGSGFEEGKKIAQLQREQSELTIKVLHSFYIPGSKFLPTKTNKRMKAIEREVKGTIKSIINKRVFAMKTMETSSTDDLLGILLDSNENEIQQHKNNSFGLSIEEVIEECKTFYFAGQDTTGNMLAWTMILLAQNTDWQKHAREEVLHVFGDKKPDINGLSRLKTMNMILNEVLRLYPQGAVIRRMIHEEIKLGNLTLPAGTIIQVNSLLLHHDKDLWGDDVTEFKPQRFSQGLSNVTKRHDASYLPFGGGPRICIGQNFALLEAKMAIAMILQRISFELSPSYSHAPQLLLTLHPQFGAHLILHKL